MSEITVITTAEDSASKSLQVTVSVDRVRAAEARAVTTYAKRVRLPGFRPGKAPEAVVRKRLHEEIRQHVLEDVIRAGWEEVRATQELKPLGDPSVRNVKFEDGQPLEFELFVEVRPEITLGRPGGFTVTRTVAPVTAEQLEEQLQSLREKQAAWLPVEGTKPSPGQMVRVDVTSLDDGRGRGAAALHDGARGWSGVAGTGGGDHGPGAGRDVRRRTSASRTIMPTSRSGARRAGSGSSCTR